MIQAIIVDDVQNAREGLKQDILDYCPDVAVIGEADSVVSAAKLLRETTPDLVFLDVDLGDGSGFDLLEIRGDIRFRIIFATSSTSTLSRPSASQRGLPAQADRSRRAAHCRGKSHRAQRQLGGAEKQPRRRPERLALNAQDKINVVKISDIVRLESNGSYTLFAARRRSDLGHPYLKEFDAMLTSVGFIRVHQSHLVNLDFIREFIKRDGGYLVLNDRKEIPVASRKRSHVMKVLNSVS